MKNKVLGAILLAAGMLASGIAFNAYRASSIASNHYTNDLRLYNKIKDRAAVEQLFKDNFYALTANPDHDFDTMLEKRSPNKIQTKYFGKMDTVVLYDKEQLAGFVSYFMTSSYAGKVLFLSINKEFRRKGYAKKLMDIAIAKLKKQGAKVIKVATRTTNIPAQTLYGTKLGFVKENEENGFFFYRKDV